MTIRDRKTLKQTATRRLAAASYHPKRLILIHSGVTLGGSLLLTLLDYLILWQIDTNGGGLASLGMRSVLETVQTVLNTVYGILMPFWSMGAAYAFLRLARGKAAWPHTLMEGFRRKGPVLRLILLQGLIYGILTFAAMWGAWFLYSMTPDGQAFAEALMKLIASGVSDYAELYEAIPEAVLMQVNSVYMPIFVSILLVLVLPASYRLRMAPYVLMEKQRTGAWKAIRTSGRITRHNGWRLVLLDLSYWWYYLIQAVLTAVGLAPALLTLLNIQLPVDDAVLYIAANVAYTALLLLFETQAKPKQQTVYALAYEALQEQYGQADRSKARPETVYSYGNEE